LKLEGNRVEYDDFRKYDAENMDAVPVLYQSGYLTIVDYDSANSEFLLGYPNEEVSKSFSKSLIERYVQVRSSDAQSLWRRFPKALRQGEIEQAMDDVLVPFFAAIPYDIQIAEEKYYQTIIHLVFKVLGFDCRSEMRLAAGRIDTLVETKDFVYCFEFKLNGTAEEALKQIDTKDYLLPWHGSGKQLIKVGVSFDYDKRNIGEWKSVKV
jgi:hypothetical protein